jgi:elongation factor 3
MAPAIMVDKAAGASSPAPSHEDIASMLDSIFTAKSSRTSVDAAYALSTLLQNSVGFRGLKGYGILDEIKKAAADKKNPVRREGAMNALGALFERFPQSQKLGEVVFLVQEEGLVALALDALSDKAGPVKESSKYALDALFDNLGAEAKVFGLMPAIIKYLGKKSGKWQGAVGGYELLGRMADKAKMGMDSQEAEKEKDILREAMGKKLECLIPVVEAGMHDLKSEVTTVLSTYDSSILIFSRSQNKLSRR